MPPTRIPKTSLGPLSIVDADVAGISPVVMTGGSAINNQVLAWNGTNWVPTTLSGFAQFADAETPVGTANGVNVTFTLEHAPNPALSLQLFVGGVLQQQGSDYTLTDDTITLGTAPSANDIIVANYRY